MSRSEEICDYCDNNAAYLFNSWEPPSAGSALRKGLQTAACGQHLRKAWDFYLEPGQIANFTVKRLKKE